MQLIDHYIRLMQVLPGAAAGEAMAVTLEAVADALCCTGRNATLILKKAQELNWLTWVPGRGRGNRSLLTLQVELSQLLFSAACEAVRRGEINGANALVAEYGEQVPGLQERVHLWLTSQFGPRVESQGSRPVDTLRMHYHRPLLRLDPAQAYLRSECHMVKQVCDTLVRYDARTGSIQPHLAYHWEASADATVWTFYLRKGVLFHHGRALTAHDVRYTLARLGGMRDGRADEKLKTTEAQGGLGCVQDRLGDLNDAELASPYRYLVDGVQEVRVCDDHTLEVILRRPNHLFLHMLSDVHLSILPHDYPADMAARMPVGTGPFRVVRNDESMLVLEAFEPYFRERALLDRVEMWIVPGYEANRYDMTFAGEAPSADEWNRTSKVERAFQHLIFNLVKPGPLQHRAFRELLDRLLDRHKMIAELGAPRVEPAGGFLPESVWERGSAAEVRVSSEEPLRLLTFPDDDHIEDAEWIQQQCAEHGIAVHIEYVSVDDLIQPERIRQADMILDGGTVGEAVELSVLDLLLSEHSFLKNMLGDDAHVQAQITTLLSARTPDERMRILGEIDRYLADHRAHLPLYRNESRVLSHPELQGIEIDAHGWIDFRSVWFKRGRESIR